MTIEQILAEAWPWIKGGAIIYGAIVLAGIVLAAWFVANGWRDLR